VSLLNGEALSIEESLLAQLAGESLYQDSPLPAAPVGRPPQKPVLGVEPLHRLLWEHRSARKVERELRSPGAWRLIEDEALRRFPNEPEMWPSEPMVRYEYEYLRNKMAKNGDAVWLHQTATEATACNMAVEAGLLNGRHGSLTQPERKDCIYGDGVVIPSLYKPRLPDPETGEIRARRDPDAGTHHTGDERERYGTKFNKLATRGDRVAGSC
jgi:hypothetical protein